MVAAISDLSPAQRQVLEALKRRGEATATELAEALEISATAVRQHLGSLRTAGLVLAERQRGQPGRPIERHRATELAERLFEASDHNLSAEILELVAAEDPALVARVFDRRRQLIVEDAVARLDQTDPEQRVEIVTRILDEQGYIVDAETVDDGHFRINLRSCAIWTVANQFDQACNSELDLIRTLVPEASVERTATKTDGAHTCCYDLIIAPHPPTPRSVSGHPGSAR